MSSTIGSLKCEVIVPNATQVPKDVFSRWSDSNVGLPALVVKVDTEHDILDAINLAKERQLTVIPGGGGHGSFVPITSNTLYLDLRKLNKVVLDKAAGTVRVGGGATTGEVVKTVTAEGFYTVWANSNAVGYAGCVLGGGNGVTNGIHGFIADAVESIQLITAAGARLDVSAASTGEEKALFNALCGAGHGLGIVTSLVVKAWPLKDLNMKDDSIWTRRLIFPPSVLDVAAETFVRCADASPSLSVVLLFIRAPPTAPVPGAPMVILTASYYGPPGEGEQVTAPLFDESVISKALKADTLLAPMATANDAFEPFNAHGGYKDFYSNHLYSVDVATIKVAFERWLQVGEQYQDAKQTTVIWSRFSTQESIAMGQRPGGQGQFIEIRDRGVMASVALWCYTPETRKALETYGEEHLALVRCNQSAVARSFPNNQRPGMDLGELHTSDNLAELRRLKATWDGQHLFWSPY